MLIFVKLIEISSISGDYYIGGEKSMHTEETAIQELGQTIMKYKRTVYGIALTQLKNRYEADDVFQDVFLLYFLKKPEFDNENAKKAWLIKTTVNKCRKYNYGKWNTHVDKSAELETIDKIGFSSEYDRDVYSAVTQLPPKLSEAVYLRFFLGLSVNETASMLGITGSAVSMRLKKAEKLLKVNLEDDFYDKK